MQLGFQYGVVGYPPAWHLARSKATDGVRPSKETARSRRMCALATLSTTWHPGTAGGLGRYYLMHTTVARHAHGLYESAAYAGTRLVERGGTTDNPQVRPVEALASVL